MNTIWRTRKLSTALEQDYQYHTNDCIVDKPGWPNIIVVSTMMPETANHEDISQ